MLSLRHHAWKLLVGLVPSVTLYPAAGGAQTTLLIQGQGAFDGYIHQIPGSQVVDTTGGFKYVGRLGCSGCSQGFESRLYDRFNTSVIPNTAVITNVWYETVVNNSIADSGWGTNESWRVAWGIDRLGSSFDLGDWAAFESGLSGSKNYTPPASLQIASVVIPVNQVPRTTKLDFEVRDASSYNPQFTGEHYWEVRTVESPFGGTYPRLRVRYTSPGARSVEQTIVLRGDGSYEAVQEDSWGRIKSLYNR
jgi:hypothetical protein